MTMTSGSRPHARGKFIFEGERKLYIRGVTYGAFAPDETGHEYHDRAVIERDFALMAANGITAVRIPHTTPPLHVLDIAHRNKLRVMVGLSAEQHVGYLIDTTDAPSVDEMVRTKVRSCAGHPALLCYAIGNEIPASMVRWIGRRRIERYLEEIYRIAKDEDPDGLVTYVNYPTTEYLQLPFLDLLSFNVYLENRDRLDAYLPRLQNIAGNRPLIMSEVGLDSIRNGEETQATVLKWQIESVFAGGCAGAFIFAWTDEWYRGDAAIDEWAFGLTDRQREPKPALKAVRAAFQNVPHPPDKLWPRVSVVVCTYNGARFIRDCCEALVNLDYPDYDVIVVNDGSTDTTAEIVGEFDFHVINTENRGLSNARNTGLESATGDVVAFIDDDAYPDRHWLTYLAATFMREECAAVGGPNIAPAESSDVAYCVSNAPGGPSHVLLTDREAEHIPGCNMAFRRDALRKIGGFDPQFRTAGDDVDVCWRIQQEGWSIAFNPAAMVWHHPRDSVRGFWKQQVGYGRAEGLLARKWPDRHNPFGHWHWSGRIYRESPPRSLAVRRPKIFHGTWGTAPFQSIYYPKPSTIVSVTQMPEWYLVIGLLFLLSGFGLIWTPLLVAFPLFIVASAAPIIRAILDAKTAPIRLHRRSRARRIKLRCLTAFLHLVQPAARLWGRLQTKGRGRRRQRLAGFAFPRSRMISIWSEHWRGLEERLKSLETALKRLRSVAVRGGDFDAWDLEVRAGLFGSVRAVVGVEEHGAGTQLIRYRAWPRVGRPGQILLGAAALSTTLFAFTQAWIAAASAAFVAATLTFWAFGDCATSMATFLAALKLTGTAEERTIS